MGTVPFVHPPAEHVNDGDGSTQPGRWGRFDRKVVGARPPSANEPGRWGRFLSSTPPARDGSFRPPGAADLDDGDGSFRPPPRLVGRWGRFLSSTPPASDGSFDRKVVGARSPSANARGPASSPFLRGPRREGISPRLSASLYLLRARSAFVSANRRISFALSCERRRGWTKGTVPIVQGGRKEPSPMSMCTRLLHVEKGNCTPLRRNRSLCQHGNV